MVNVFTMEFPVMVSVFTKTASFSWEPIINYVDGKFLEFFNEETKIERKERPVDKCVHLCLYFIEPSGHG